MMSAVSTQALPPSSLIICTRNRPDLLGDTIKSILEADEVPNELIIIDQSDQPSPVFAGRANNRNCNIRYIWSEVIGVSHARNMGFSLAEYSIVALIDDDMWVTRNWYGELIRALLQAGGRSVVTGRVESAPSDDPDKFTVTAQVWKEVQVFRGRVNTDVLSSGHMAMYRSDHVEMGGFDERLGPGTRFPAAEDNDYGYRLLKAGYQIIYVYNSVTYHRSWRRRKAYVYLYWGYGRGQGAFYAKHLRLQDYYLLRRWLQDYVRFFRGLPRRLWKREVSALCARTVFLCGEWLGAVEWILSYKG